MVTAMETSSDQGEMENSTESIKQEASGEANAVAELVSIWDRVTWRLCSGGLCLAEARVRIPKMDQAETGYKGEV